MARYADIDVLLEHLTTSDEGNFRTAITQWLEMHQVEDVAPVIHAHWILHDDNNDIWDCSNCKMHIFINLLYGNKAEYCPKCGAKMDEEVK